MKRFFSVKPLDVISARGNRHFGVSAGDFGTSVFPPLPSVFSGAFRSFLAARNVSALTAIEKNEPISDPVLAEVLGTPSNPGTFSISSVRLGRKKQNENEIEQLFPLPADLVVHKVDSETELRVLTLQPTPIPKGISTSYPLPSIPVTRDSIRKPISGWFLTQEGWKKYLYGQFNDLSKNLVHCSKLWKSELRMGIGLDYNSRTVETGKLFTSEYFTLMPNALFIIGIEGDKNSLPNRGIIRLGGDGRGAEFEACTIVEIEPPIQQIQESKRFRIILTSHGCFNGCFLPGIVKENNDIFLVKDNFRARLLAAAIPSFEIISGWDIYSNTPKKAERVVPAGSVFWFDKFEGNVQALCNWVKDGLWDKNIDPIRRAEGYNRAILGV